MKFSELWLREWVNPEMDIQTLAEQITMAGLEVDGIEAVSGEFHGVVTGKVVTCAPHPNADKLRVTKVDIGADHLLDIVCGAPNCREGLNVAVATVGTVLPGDFKIKAAKLRGEPSEGMLCSFAELGIAVEQSGIIELPTDTPVGIDIREYLQLHDHMIEISVTPNRADCLSIMGVARDVAAMTGMAMQTPSISPANITIKDTFPIRVEVPDACPRYLCRVIKGINMSAVTPIWMQEKLRRGGIRSIDPVVDVTNYVLLELGQPMHAFDLSTLEGEVIVRMGRADEKLLLLDNREITLNEDSLVIADSQQALALGGIFGGKLSGVTDKTQDILLECAFFNPLAIIGRARHYGLHTESSHRYERGVDPNLQFQALERATTLLLAICGGDAGPLKDVSSATHLPRQSVISLGRDKLDKLAGHFIEDEQVTSILIRLGCQIDQVKKDWNIVPPGWRFDLSVEEDLIEEVIRVYGYNNIPGTPVKSHLLMTSHKEEVLSLKRVKSLLTDKGYQEAITYSFVDPKIQEELHPTEENLCLPNPISAEMSVMRLSLWTGLLQSVIYNQNRQQNRIRLFESGLRFIPDSRANLGVRQELVLSGVISGYVHDENWHQGRKKVDFYDLKGDLESIFELTGKIDSIEFKRKNNPALHPGQSAAIYLQENLIGWIGVIHPELETKLNLQSPAVVFELYWDALAHRLLPESNEISRFPANRRDIAVIVADSIMAADIVVSLKKLAIPQIMDVNLFDVYQGAGVEKGHKSLALSLTLQDQQRTLEEDEMAKIVATCVNSLKNQFGAILRD